MLNLLLNQVVEATKWLSVAAVAAPAAADVADVIISTAPNRFVKLD